MRRVFVGDFQGDVKAESANVSVSLIRFGASLRKKMESHILISTVYAVFNREARPFE